ncbi:hypothetical protein A9G24_07315 [Gilliamella sp. App6-5]|uniref:hypothetical protein n=1 Tax=Gilliamella sp. App6-5 TaxID=3120232 RepID=UPI00080E44BC|nr:hypothetical protein [Gilliamella apicola]OCG13709.1 hypothetical protein A9G24_07315 [Gilliamella apicola]
MTAIDRAYITYRSAFSRLALSFNCRLFHYKSAITAKIFLKPKLTKIGLILLSQWVVVSPVHAVLTATSNHFIIGNAPQVVPLSSADKQGFTVNGVFYSEAIGNIKASEVKEFDSNLTLNDFKVATYTSTNLDKVENYSDIDGDSADPKLPFKVETTYYWWYDNNGVRIIGDDKKKAIGCGSGFSMPLKLIVKTNVKAHSAYGIPDESEQITLTKTYQIASKSELCYAKPNSTIVHPEYQWIGTDLRTDAYYFNRPEYANRHPLVGGGYTQDYVPNYGFKAQPTISSNTFPTTGFPGAKFQLVMTGAQNDYRYQVINNPGGGVSIDQNGVVKLNSKPSGNVTVRATLKRDNSVIHDYQFNPTSIWGIPQNFRGAFNAVQQHCGGLQNMMSRAQLTNSPRYEGQGAELGGDKLTLSNSYTRAIGGSILGEWGWTTKSSYPDSDWQEYYAPPDFTTRYWTSDSSVVEGVQLPYVVHNHDGFTSTFVTEAPWLGYAICKG